MTITSQQAKQQKIIKEMPKEIQPILNQHFTDHSIGFVSAKTVSELLKASSLTHAQLGLLLLPLATNFAEAPVSNFNVGAIAFDGDGNAYFGANFEFANTHIGQTIHAEQSAIAHGWMHGAKDLALLVINYAPCGHCRQFINEVTLTEDFYIQLPDVDAKPLGYYLPDSFGGSDLGIEDKILGQTNLPQNLQKNTDFIKLAKIAHDTCHAPYSGNKSGIALQYDDEEVVTGRYAENAAFNPTLPALQVALNYRRMQGKNGQMIKRAVMVETPTSLQQKQNTTELLAKICNVSLEYHAV